MYGKKSLSIEDQEIIMEQIRNYPCLYNKSKMSYKERDVNRNAWSKVVKKFDFKQNVWKTRWLLYISSGKESKS